MASRKNLKKVIAFVVDDLATEAFFASYDAKGDTEQPYAKPEKNRVALCIVK